MDKEEKDLEKLVKGVRPSTIKKATDKMKEAVAETPEEAEQLSFSFLPTPMTRTTPFFPMSNIGKGKRLFEEIKFKHSWGSIEVKGPRLSTFDEDVLLAVLACVKVMNATLRRKKETETENGRITYTFKTNLNVICGYLNLEAGGMIYKLIEQALDRLSGTVVKLEKKGEYTMAGAILAGWGRDKITREITITLNPYFYEMFNRGLLTYLDLTLRRKLKGSVSKALMRFYESHQKNPAMGMNVLGEAINLGDLEPKRLKSRLKKGLAELVNIGYLREFSINKKGIVTVDKIQLPPARAKLAKSGLKGVGKDWAEKRKNESPRDRPMIMGPNGEPILLLDYLKRLE